MEEKTYTQLYNLIKALSGVDEYTTSEKASIQALVNRRAKKLYTMDDSWPRFLTVGEERTLSTNPAQTIPYAQAGLSTIYEFIKIHKQSPFLRDTVQEFDFFVDSSGAHVLNVSTDDTSSLFVTYKTFLPTYSETSTNIPEEWFLYLSHAVYADMLRADDQTDRALAEEGIAMEFLADELTRIPNLKNVNIISTKIRTHLSQQHR